MFKNNSFGDSSQNAQQIRNFLVLFRGRFIEKDKSIGSLKGIMFIGVRAKTNGTPLPIQQKQFRQNVLSKQSANPDTQSAKVVNFGLATWIWINTSSQMNTRCVRTK